MKIKSRIRPYEKVKGSTNMLCDKWISVIKDSFNYRVMKNYKYIVKSIIKEFEELPRLDIFKPKVGLVGELLVKFNPIANNNVVHNDFLALFLASAKNQIYNYTNLDGKYINKLKSEVIISIIEKYQKIYIEAFNNSIFYVSETIDELINNASKVLSLGNPSGEGWKLAGEILELGRWGVKNVICMQPFGCLPSHTVARGSIKSLKKEIKDLNIVTIEYDPGASEVNQNNSIKLMLATVFNKI